MAENSNEIGGNELGGSTDSSKVQRANGSTTYDKSQTLVDIANNTFRELCRTLENEQTKLMELEERRKKLQEEMQRLKMEIEEEKQSYRLNLVESVTDNLEALNDACSTTTSVAFVDGMSDQTESVHEFIERQKAEIQRLTSENTQMPPLEACMELNENDKEYQNEIVKEDVEKDISNKDVVRDNGSNDASLNHPDQC